MRAEKGFSNLVLVLVAALLLGSVAFIGILPINSNAAAPSAPGNAGMSLGGSGDAEYLIITRPMFESALEDLVELKEERMSVKVMTVEEIAGRALIYPSDDAWVDERDPDWNYGSETKLSIGPDFYARSYLKFLLSSLPPGATILDAKLYLYNYYVGDWTNMYVGILCRVNDDSWSEDTITYDTAPARGSSEDWLTVDEEDQWYSWDVTEWAQNEFGGDKVVSVCIYGGQPHPPDFGWKDFRSKEYEGIDYDPHLVVTYSSEGVYPGRDIPEQIRNCIRDHYENHGTQWVLLAGDVDPDDRQLGKWGETVADTYLDQNSSDGNFGNETSLLVKSEVDHNARTLLKFDLSEIPDDAKVVGARLQLYLHEGNAEGRPYTLHHLTRTDWTEDGASWQTYDGVNPWANEGGDYTAVDKVSTTVGSPGWFTWQGNKLVNQVQYALDNANKMACFLIKDLSESSDGSYFSKFYSKEYGDNGPRLKIQYVPNPILDKSWEVPIRYAWGPGPNDPYYYGWCVPTDYYYAGLDGTWDDDGDDRFGERGEADWFADVYVGRMPARNVSAIDNIVHKVVYYETDPPRRDICLFGAEISPGHHGGTVVNEYIRDTYIPDVENVHEYYWVDGNLSYDNFVNAVNDYDPILINAVAHGNGDGIYSTESGPTFVDLDTPNYITNKGFLMYANACKTISFGQDTTVGEELLWDADGGAIGYVGATRVLGGWSERQDYKFFEEFFWGNEHRQGATLYKSKIDYIKSYCSETMYSDERHNLLTTMLLGDPELEVAYTPFVSASISSSYQSGLPGTTLYYTVTITNLGDVSDTYSLAATDDGGWSLSVSPTSLTIGAGASDSATLSVTVPAAAIGDFKDNIRVTATSQADDSIRGRASCIAHVTIVRDIMVSISPNSQSGSPGETLSYTITITNEGNVDDTYDLSASDNAGWVATRTEVSPSIADIWARDVDGWFSPQLKFDLGLYENVASAMLWICAGAIGSNWPHSCQVMRVDNQTWDETMENFEFDDSLVDTIEEANDLWFYSEYDDIDVSHQLKNNGDARYLTIRLSDLSSGWTSESIFDTSRLKLGKTGYFPYIELLSSETSNPPYLELIFKAISPTSLTIPPGENRTATLTITIPGDATPGTEDVIAVTATSQADPSVSDSASCIARAVPPWEGTATFKLEDLYKVGLEKDLQLNTGSELVVKFYKYDNITLQAESIIDEFAPPHYVEGNEKVPHPSGLPVEIATLVLTTDDTEEVISTIASFVVRKVDLETRFMDIPFWWSQADAAGKVELETEFMGIPFYQSQAPS